MTKKNNDNTRETIAAIDLIRTAKSQVPINNKIFLDLLAEDEHILLERLFQLLRQDKAPVKKEPQQFPPKRKSRGKEGENDDIVPQRPD